MKQSHHRAEIRSTPDDYWRAQMIVPALASILDELDGDALRAVEAEAKAVVHRHGGLVRTALDFRLCVAEKVVR